LTNLQLTNTGTDHGARTFHAGHQIILATTVAALAKPGGTIRGRRLGGRRHDSATGHNANSRTAGHAHVGGRGDSAATRRAAIPTIYYKNINSARSSPRHAPASQVPEEPSTVGSIRHDHPWGRRRRHHSAVQTTRPPVHQQRDSHGSAPQRGHRASTRAAANILNFGNVNVGQHKNGNRQCRPRQRRAVRPTPATIIVGAAQPAGRHQAAAPTSSIPARQRPAPGQHRTGIAFHGNVQS